MNNYDFFLNSLVIAMFLNQNKGMGWGLKMNAVGGCWH